MDSILSQSERIVRAMNRRAASGTMSESTYRRRFNTVRSAATRYGENAFEAARRSGSARPAFTRVSRREYMGLSNG